MNKNTQPKVFDRDWFAKHQRSLVWLINTWVGNLIFQYRKMGHYPTNRIVGITPNSIIEQLRVFTKGKKKGQIELRQHFFGRNEYARKLYFVLLPLWWAMHAWDTLFANRFAPQLNFNFDTLTQYPGSLGANNPVDGYILLTGAVWATVRDASVGGTVVATQTSSLFIMNNVFEENYTVARGFFLFDTSALTAQATISDAVLSLFGNGTATVNQDTITIHIVSSSPAADNDLIKEDYDQIGSTSFASKTFANYVSTNETTNDFTLATPDDGKISKTGITKLGTRGSKDYDNEAPTGRNIVYCYFADNATNKPKLVVTYSLPAAGPANLKTLNTNLKANIKSYNTNLIANVKSINTNV